MRAAGGASVRALAWVFWLLAANAPAWAADALSLWEARSERATVYLFGSVHVCRASCFPLDPAVLRRFDASARFALEVDLADPRLASLFDAAARRVPGAALTGTLSPSDRQRLRAVLDRFALTSQDVEPLRPWMLAMLLTLKAAQAAGFETALGIDNALLERGRAARKPMLALERPEEQIAAVAGGSETEQADALMRLIGQIERDEVPAMLESLVTAWRDGDAPAIAAHVETELTAAERERLLTARNAVMTRAILSAAREGESLFVVVGAAHLVGDDGIVARLARAGYQLRQIERGQ